MKRRIWWLTVLVAAGLVLAAGAAGALPDALGTEADVPGAINYQGRLTDAGGVPRDGTFPMRFQIYDAEIAGTLWWDSGIINVEVDQGLFNVVLDVDPHDFDGRDLWLRILVDGEWLSPRQHLLPVPYALSLRPGATIKGDPDPAGWVLNVEMAGNHATRTAIWGQVSTGDAVRGSSPGGYGLAGYTDDGYAVVGMDHGRNPARGYGGYFTSDNGVGLAGYSAATPGEGNFWAEGVRGKSEYGVGVHGQALDNGVGVLGDSKWGYGVRGYGHLGGVRGYSEASTGTWGESSSWSGVYAKSETDFGVEAYTAKSDGNYGLFTPDNIWSNNYHLAGAVMHLAQNGGGERLEAGDVVVFSGAAAPLAEGGPPVIQVRRATAADSSAVAGVVYSRYNLQAIAARQAREGQAAAGGLELTPDGPVAPGEYLLLVVQGPCLVRVDAAGGAIRPGDLLSSAASAAHAGKAPKAALPGTVLGKALEGWNGGQGQIYAFVTLQ